MKQVFVTSLVILAVGCSGGSDSRAVALDASAGGAVALDASAGGAAGGDASACGTYEQLGARLAVDTLGPRGGVYDGPAIVERSTAEELILTFAFPTSTSGAADTTAVHAKLSGLNPMPILPRGAKLWLSKNPAGNFPVAPPYNPPSSWALTVRDRRGGTILFGAVRNAPDQTSVPIATGSVTPICVAKNPFCSNAAGNKVTYSAVEVQGDTPVTIGDNQTATVRLGGVDYYVTVTARQVTVDPVGGCPADYTGYNEVSVDVQAKDLQSLINMLQVGDLPACIEGNDQRVDASFSLTEVDVGTTYDGPVFYQGKGPTEGTYDSLMFSVVGLTSVDVSSPPQLWIVVSPGILPEPKVGDKFWATIPDLTNATLRESQGGPLVLATVYEFTPAEATGIEQLLGVAVDAKQRCHYAVSDGPLAQKGILSLWDVSFLTTPSVVVQSDSLGALQLGGKDYAVWVSGEGLASFTIYAR